MIDLRVISLFMAVLHFAVLANERLQLIHAGIAELIKVNGREIRELKKDVFFRQGDAYMRCQRALFDVDRDYLTLYQEVEIDDGKHCICGDRVTYEGPEKIERAFGNVHLTQEGQLLTADSVVYHQKTQEAHAVGNVHMTDFVEKATLTAQDVRYDRITDYGVATGNPQIIKQDTSSRDSLMIIGKKMQIWGEQQLAIVSDSVKINKGNMKAYCRYAKFFTDQEKLFLYESPRMIEQNRHISGDSIQIQLNASDFESGIVWGNAVVTSKDSIYENVLTGKLITMSTEQDSIRTVIVDHQAENLYHVFNDNGEMEGINNINGDRIIIKFNKKKLKYVRVESDPGKSLGKFVPSGITKTEKESR